MIQYDGNHGGGVNTIIGFVCGILGGSIDFAMRANTLTIIAIVQAGFTALVCGAAGVAGKEFYLYVKTKIKKSKKLNQ